MGIGQELNLLEQRDSIGGKKTSEAAAVHRAGVTGWKLEGT